ncbi:MAG: glycosyltransferase family 2 protein [Thermofilaceae archaeon]|nr:glycosyltransferase family 2 protein [Thermofilaceae archaeon]
MSHIKCSNLRARDVTIVIPTLDEEDAIKPVIEELQNLGWENILVVDGGSKDHTRDIASSLGAQVILQEGRGKAQAIRTAIKYVETPYMLVMDGDFTYPAKHIAELLDKVERERLDEVIGVRKWGRENIPLINRLGNWVITTTFNLLFGTHLTDVCSGMYILKTEAIRRVSFESKGFSVEVEIAAHIASTSRRIGEVPIEYRPRIGTPKLGRRHGFTIMFDALRLALRYNPVFILFAASSTVLIPSLALALWVGYRWLLMGVRHYVWGIIAIVGLGVGFISLLLAITALYLKRLEFRILEKLYEAGR